jgi:hypothetical protein
MYPNFTTSKTDTLARENAAPRSTSYPYYARLAGGMQRCEVTKDALIGAVQRTKDGVVLGLENGSMTQRVQVKFLREVVTRI